MKVKDFVFVAKPGIVFGNVFAGVGGFMVGSPDAVGWSSLFGLAAGMTAIIAASCVVNNYLDADIDARMKRTAKRPSVTGAIPLQIGRIYAAVLYVLGFGLLFGLTNLKTALIGLFGAVMYTVVYGYAKRRTPWATLIGAFPGATPPLAGYVAATGRFEEAAWLLFIIMFAWQMPHFHAIAIRRFEDYKAADIPVMPGVHGLARTVWEMRLFGLAFITACYLLARWGHAGFMFGLATVAVGMYWLQPMFSPHWRRDREDIAKVVFKRSLLVLLVLNTFMTLSHVLL
ncbi:protoheme IX farnesyltransferase [Candidatus Saccharibacteria bacterium]|nr:MAG: protoheme IX farnesyltransferase [Candidatus Saccharibacteria bacterium]